MPLVNWPLEGERMPGVFCLTANVRNPHEQKVINIQHKISILKLLTSANHFSGIIPLHLVMCGL